MYVCGGLWGPEVSTGRVCPCLMYMCGGLWVPEVRTACFFQMLSTLGFETGSLTELEA